MTHAQIEAAAQAIVDDIIADLTDRRGLKSEWHNIDDDVQAEIVTTWRQIAEARLRAMGGGS